MKAHIDRRQLLKLGLSSGALAALPLGCAMFHADAEAELLERVGDSPLPLEPTRKGRLRDGDFDTLTSLCRYVDENWQLQTDMALYLDRLKADLHFKTDAEPSYLTEYENAIRLVQLTTRGADDPDQAWATLLFAHFEAPRLEETKLGRARAFVFAELITHQIPISGAFKSFGLWNYRGYFGGSYANADSYRRGSV